MKLLAQLVVALGAIYLIAFLCLTMGAPIWLALTLGIFGYVAIYYGNELLKEESSISGKIILFLYLSLSMGLLIGAGYLVFWVTDNFGFKALIGGFIGLIALGLILIAVAAAGKRKYKKTHADSLPKILTEAEEEALIAQELAEVKGNWLKKKMIGKRLKREYAAQRAEAKEKIKQATPHWQALTIVGKKICKIPFFLTWYITVGVVGIFVWMFVLGSGFNAIVDIKWLAYVNVLVALIAAIVLTLKHHSYQAFLMWTTFLVYASGALFYHANLTTDFSTHILRTYESIPFLYHPYDVPDGAVRAGYMLLTLTSLCFALYSSIKRWAIPLWGIFSIVIYITTVIIYPEIGLYEIECGIISIVGQCLNVPYWFAFLLCNFYLWGMLTVFCTLPTAVKGYRIKVLSQRNQQLPAIVGIGWLLLHVLLFVGMWCVLFHGASLESQATIIRNILISPGKAVGIFFSTPCYKYYFNIPIPILLDLFASWLVYLFVKREDDAEDKEMWYDWETPDGMRVYLRQKSMQRHDLSH